MINNRYTYVVVGAGAAGCVVANRLSADPDHRVLLLEAGPPDRSPLIHMPVGFTKLTSPKVNWRFETVPQRHLGNRPMYYPQGRTLGGSTSINATGSAISSGASIHSASSPASSSSLSTSRFGPALSCRTMAAATIFRSPSASERFTITSRPLGESICRSASRPCR